MSNVTIETEQSAAAAPPSEPARKPNKTAQTTKRATKTKARKATAQRTAAKAGKKTGDQRAAKGSNKKAQVIAMMRRTKGATLAEIVAATGWQKHTIRGFASIQGKKSGQKIESSKNAAGERVYKIVK